MESYCPQFILKQRRAITGLRRYLYEKGYQLGPRWTIMGRREIYDTFDWRLFNNHLLLGQDSDGSATLFLFSVANAGLISQCTTTIGRFFHEPDCAVIASRLAPVIEARALMSPGNFALRMERGNIADKHGNIIARLFVERLMKQPPAAKKTGPARGKQRRRPSFARIVNIRQKTALPIGSVAYAVSRKRRATSDKTVAKTPECAWKYCRLPGSAAVSQPVAGKFSWKAAAGYQSRDGFPGTGIRTTGIREKERVSASL